jgi:hypothetical protein
LVEVEQLEVDLQDLLVEEEVVLFQHFQQLLQQVEEEVEDVVQLRERVYLVVLVAELLIGILLLVEQVILHP